MTPPPQPRPSNKQQPDLPSGRSDLQFTPLPRTTPWLVLPSKPGKTHLLHRPLDFPWLASASPLSTRNLEFPPASSSLAVGLRRDVVDSGDYDSRWHGGSTSTDRGALLFLPHLKLTIRRCLHPRFTDKAPGRRVVEPLVRSHG